MDEITIERQFMSAIKFDKLDKAKELAKLHPFLVKKTYEISGYSRSITVVLYRSISAINKIIDFIVELGININIQNKFGQSILTYYVRQGNIVAVEILIANNIDINVVDIHNRSALFYATKHPDIFFFLLGQENIDLLIRDINDKTIIDYIPKRRVHFMQCEMIKKFHKKVMKQQQKYYENLMEEKLKKQKEELYEEIYAPNGIGYEAAKNRFENKN